MTEEQLQSTTAENKFLGQQLKNMERCVSFRCQSSLLTIGGGSAIAPLANQPVETWICLFVPRHVRMYAESFVLSLGQHVSGN